MNNTLLNNFITDNADLLKCDRDKKNAIQVLEMIQSFDKKLDLMRKNVRQHDKLQRVLFRLLDNFLVKIYRLEIKIENATLTDRLKKFFRKTIGGFLFQSQYFKYGYLKPRGYPGDYQIIEAMYNNRPISKGIGRLLDVYFLNVNYVQAVRARKDSMKKFLKVFIKNYKGKEIKILNIACGSCREVRELVQEGISPSQKIIFSLLDQDRETLSFAKKQLESLPAVFNQKFFENNVMDFIKHKNLMYRRLGKQDLIYSIGLADYLPDSILGPLIKTSFNLLNRNGILIIAHKNVRKLPAPAPDWMCDWKFYPRNVSEFLALVNKNSVSKKNIKFIFDKSKLVYYCVLSDQKTEIL